MIPQEILLGPITIHVYGLIIAIAIYFGWFLAKKRADLYKIPQRLFDDPILLIPLVLAIFGARIYHVLDKFSFYKADLKAVFLIWNGGLGIWGALAGAFLGFWIISKVKKIDFLKLLDLASPSLLLGQAIGRFGNFVNQEGFGPPTKMPWGVYIDLVNRPIQYINSTRFHPTFFYEATLDAIFFVILIYLTNLSFPRKRESRTGFSIRSRMTAKPGQTFALYLIFYATGRFIAEFWRIDTWVMGDIKIAHVVASLVFFLGISLFFFLDKKNGRLNS